ncbi:hypothetical protein HBDW_45780 [Herbaspirillum sp. DW155]|uniref:hypothetical protein n=1 Tax=Herbaspirillum sp. DW155 TaxID=3095609 RepID=UPI003090E2CF|nr:hypothetical protein HBDW_45780 [Herbaspirillum sp. DW155]
MVATSKVESLKKYLVENPKRVWGENAPVPIFADMSKPELEGQKEFLRLGTSICNWFSRSLQDKYRLPIEFLVLERPQPNAWAVWPGTYYGVLLTTSLIENMQSVCGQVIRFLKSAENSSEKFFLKTAWDALPHNEESYESYGGLLAHIAFTFIVNHELAHVGLGHERAFALKRENEQVSADMFVSEECIGEIYDVAAAVGDSKLKNWEYFQALEVDADINGLVNTRFLVFYLKSQFENKGLQEAGSMGPVWNAVLTNDYARELAISIGVAIGLFCLRPRIEKAKSGLLEGRTHPPLPTRLMLLQHMNNRFSGPSTSDVRGDSILVASALFMMLSQAESLLQCGVSSVQQEATANNTNRVVDDALRLFGTQEALARYDVIGAHFKKLQPVMQELRKITMPWTRVNLDECFKWEESEDVGALKTNKSGAKRTER